MGCFKRNRYWRSAVRLAQAVVLAILGSNWTAEGQGPTGYKSGSQVIGVLYGIDSGTGAGTVRLLVEGKVRFFAFEKPAPFEFVKPSCYDAGAIWKVELRKDPDVLGGMDPAIVRARCSGQFDEGVRAAVGVVAGYLRAVYEGDYERARRFVIQGPEGRPVHESFLGTFGACDLSLVSVRCMDVGKVDHDEAAIYVARCLVRCRGKVDDWIFRLKRVGAAQRWRIREIRPGQRLWFQLWR